MASKLRLLLVVLVQLSAASASKQRLIINKCCDVNEELDATGGKCVNVTWGAPYEPARRALQLDVLLPPLESQWLRRWLPPGIAHDTIDEVWVRSKPSMYTYTNKFPMETTTTWDTIGRENNTFWRNAVVLNGSSIILPNIPSGEPLRTIEYCIDASQNPNTAFILVVRSYCSQIPYGVKKCCKHGEAMAITEGKLTCKKEKKPNRFNFVYNVVLPAFPSCPKSRTLSWSPAPLRQVIHTDFCLNIEIQETTNKRRTMLCADSFVDGKDTDSTLVFCEWSRVAKGVYLQCRYVPLASVALLVAALGAIAGSARQRASAHGWALASHAACLLAFNAAQVLFLLLGPRDFDNYAFIPLGKVPICLSFAFFSYFFLVAAACWLTAVSVNMVTGFRLQQGLRAGAGRERRRFLWLCAGAWGFPVALTAAAISTFFAAAHPIHTKYSRALFFQKFLGVTYPGPWYLPSFVETRTCFSDILFLPEVDSFMTNKHGSLLFYFGPLSALLVCNVVCLGVTARRVHFLRRGNSLLQRERQEGGGAKGRGGALTQAQSVVVYIKLLLSAGLFETVMEIVTWAASQSSGNSMSENQLLLDHTYVYRSVGAVCDLLRALCVLWLAAPHAPGHVAALYKRLLGRIRKEGKKQ